MNASTLKTKVHFEGKGLHTGTTGRVTVHPQEAGKGVSFHLGNHEASVPLTPEIVVQTTRGTALQVGSRKLWTVEHLLAALRGVGITEAVLEVQGDEIPILDGSALEFAQAFWEVRHVHEGIAVPILELNEPLEVRRGESFVCVAPFDELKLRAEIHFPSPGLEAQAFEWTWSPEAFLREVAPARTFCLEEEIETLRRQGLIQGGDLNCALVWGKKGLLNGPLRFPEECARHKILDLLGDLALIPAFVKASVQAYRAGHALHVELAKRLWERYRSLLKTPSRGGERTMLEAMDIQKILPHRYPFLLVDRIVELVPGKSAVGIKNVTVNEPFFQGHFPGDPIMPGVLILEAMAQVGGVAMLKNLDHPNGSLVYLAGMEKVRFRRPVRPGDQLRMEVNVLFSKGNIHRAACRALVDGNVSVEAEITSAIIKKEAS